MKTIPSVKSILSNIHTKMNGVDAILSVLYWVRRSEDLTCHINLTYIHQQVSIHVHVKSVYIESNIVSRLDVKQCIHVSYLAFYSKYGF